jgi:hypothetical protein
MMIEPRLSMNDVLKIYRKSRRTIERWITSRNMPGFKIGKEFFFIPSRLQEWEHSFQCVAHEIKNDDDVEIIMREIPYYPNATGGRLPQTRRV